MCLACILLSSGRNGLLPLKHPPPHPSHPSPTHVAPTGCKEMPPVEQKWRQTRVSRLLNSVQSLSRVRLFATPWNAARQASLSISNSWSFLKLVSVESLMPSNHLILCRPRLLLPSIFPSIRVFSNESALRIRWPEYWSFSFCISPSSEYSGLISFSFDWLDLSCPRDSQKFSNTTVGKHQFFGAQLSLWSSWHSSRLLLEPRWPPEHPGGGRGSTREGRKPG